MPCLCHLIIRLLQQHTIAICIHVRAASLGSCNTCAHCVLYSALLEVVRKQSSTQLTSVRMMSAAPLAAEVAPATAMPTLAFFKAGASFTPSPALRNQVRTLYLAMKATELPTIGLFYVFLCHLQ